MKNEKIEIVRSPDRKMWHKSYFAKMQNGESIDPKYPVLSVKKLEAIRDTLTGIMVSMLSKEHDVALQPNPDADTKKKLVFGNVKIADKFMGKIILTNHKWYNFRLTISLVHIESNCEQLYWTCEFRSLDELERYTKTFMGYFLHFIKHDNLDFPDDQYTMGTELERWAEDEGIDLSKGVNQILPSWDAEQKPLDPKDDAFGINAVMSAFSKKATDVYTPLHRACMTCHERFGLIDSLIHYGADVNARTHWGETPLHLHVVRGEYPYIAEILIDAGADVNAVDTNMGNTPLHDAACMCDIEMITTLLSRGADKTIRNNKGQLPYDIAMEYHLYDAKAKHKTARKYLSVN